MRLIASAAICLLALGCGSSDADSPPVGDPGTDALYPAIVDAAATLDDSGDWSFAVTVSSPYDSPAQYADAWRVLGPDGAEYGIRILTHDHASEQPFTRSTSGVDIPDNVDSVFIEGRDLVNGWSGQTFELALNRQ